MHRTVLAVLLLVAGCSSADETASTTLGAPTTSISSSSSATATTGETTTTASITSVAPTSVTTGTISAATTSSTAPRQQHEPVLVFYDRTAGAPRLLFVDRAGEIVRYIPLDRRSPTVYSVVDDHQGGIVVTNAPPPVAPNSIIWYPAGSSSWHVVAAPGELETLNWPQPSVVEYRGADVLLFGASTYRDYHDAAEGVDVMELHREVRIAGLAGGSATTLISAESKDFAWGATPSSGATPADMGYDGQRLMILWSDAECTWLEFRDESGAVIDMASNPLPRNESCDHTVTDARLSRHGRDVVAESHPPGLLTVYDLIEGSEETLEGVVVGGVFFDGDRTIGAVTIGENGEIAGGLLVTIEPSGLQIENVALGEDVGGAWPLGVLSRVPDLPRDATLASDAPSTPCAASNTPPIDDQLELPEGVKATRNAIAGAAADCDLFRLAELGKDMFWAKLGDCDEGPLVSIDEVDPLPLWYQNLDLIVTLMEALDTDPELVNGVYRWRVDGQTIGISENGTWVEYEVTPPRAPCETIWCTC